MVLSSVWRKAILLPPLLFALWLLTDEEEEHMDTARHLAVLTALKRHPPSLRVYRAILELTLLLFGTSFALFVWTRTVGTKVIGQLLFQPPMDDEHHNSSYDPVSTANNNTGDETNVLAAEDALDADYDSEGEVQERHIHPEPPLASSVAGAALDLLLLTLVSLFLFTLSSAEGGRYIDGVDESSTMFQLVAKVAAPVFPLVLIVGTTIMSLLPWKRRRNFWIITSYTIGAPLYDVTFRDGFIGDIFTSAVRPMQDLAFTAFYVLSGLQGWWTQDFNLDEAATPVERSWILHTAILPACMVSPLWWRFMQNLRQTYDNKKRWPYLGNALKYLVAAEVAMFGVFDPQKKERTIWLTCFVIATLYQVWWDVFMDWELISISGLFKVSLRPKRLYPYKFMYWGIFIINFALRFCWILTFMPHRYLDRTGALQKTFGGDLSSILSPLLASAEIIRRTLWGLIRFEVEAIKSQSGDPGVQAQVAKVSGYKDHDSFTEDGRTLSPLKEIELKSMGVVVDDDEMNVRGGGAPPPPLPPFNSPNESQSSFGGGPIFLQNDMSANSDLQILTELCLWATVFMGGGLVAAAHRETF